MVMEEKITARARSLAAIRRPPVSILRSSFALVGAGGPAAHRRTEGTSRGARMDCQTLLRHAVTGSIAAFSLAAAWQSLCQPALFAKALAIPKKTVALRGFLGGHHLQFRRFPALRDFILQVPAESFDERPVRLLRHLDRLVTPPASRHSTANVSRSICGCERFVMPASLTSRRKLR